ncbi:endonuclease MutS2 [bacterium]|nr:endonuclease MutS2 [bacterium]
MSETSNHFYHALEFDTVLERVSQFAISEPGRQSVLSQKPFLQKEDLSRELASIQEMKELLRFDDPLPIVNFNLIPDIIEKAGLPGSFVDANALLKIARVLKISREVSGYINLRRDKYPRLNAMTEHISSFEEIEKEISWAIGPDADVLSRASNELGRIRRDIERAEARVKNQLEKIMKEMASKGYTQEDSLAVKQGILVVPMKESFRGRLKGIIIDQSASGQTVFMEPFEVAELENQVRRLRIEEKDEIEKILIRLSAMVREEASAILNNYYILTAIDSIYARAGFSDKYDCVPAVISKNEIILNNAYHPLLMIRRGKQDVVPLTIRLGEDLKTVVVTGPNAGGKTVALKTIGVLSLMHMHGLHIPASLDSALPIFSGLFIDIGDEQSIEQDLSSFSSHIEIIKNIVENADSRSLILLDEIGSATDPAEGSALAEVLLRYFTLRGSITVATTHMGSLKVFAQQEDGVENGSMAFNRETLNPTYQFRMGIPGSSYAFEISERLGLKKELIEDARKIAGTERGRLDRLILTMEEKYQKAAELLQGAEIKDSRLKGLIKLYEDKLEKLKEESEQEKKKIVIDAEELLKEANVTIERLIKNIREEKASTEVIKKAKKELSVLKTRVKKLSPVKKGETPVISSGDFVKWKGHKGRGKVESAIDNKGRVIVQWGDLRLRVAASELSVLEQNMETEKKSSSVKYAINEVASDEVDLRGMTSLEAVQVVDNFLGAAAVSGLERVRIIHGKGTGALRNTINDYMKSSTLVKSWRLGNWKEGDTGVTIVELK